MAKVDVGARKVAPTYGKAAFLTHCAKASGMVVLESAGERVLAHMLQIDPSVLRFTAQPYTVDLADGRLLRTAQDKAEARLRHVKHPAPRFYTPDFEAAGERGRRVALECKLSSHPADSPDEVAARATVAALLRSHGVEFHRVVVPAALNHPLRMNVFALHQASLQPRAEVEAVIGDRASALADVLDLGCPWMLGELVKQLDVPFAVIPRLLLDGALALDLATVRIKADAVVTPAAGDLTHLQLWTRFVS